MVSSIEEIPGPSEPVRTFIDAWKAARRGNLVPTKQDFDPLSVPQLLPDMWIYNYDRQEDVFRCRLSGERVNNAWGYSIAGKLSQDILGADKNRFVAAIWKKVLDVPLIHYTKLDRRSADRLYVAERTVVPLSDAAGTRLYVLGLSLYSLGGVRHVAPPKIPKIAYQIRCSDL